MRIVKLSEVGLLTVDEAAAIVERDEKTVRRWVTEELLPVVVVGSGNRATYLLRRKDVQQFKKPTRGRGLGTKNKSSATTDK